MSWRRNAVRIYPQAAQAAADAAVPLVRIGPPPVAQLIPQHPPVVSVNLYEKYSERMENPYDIIPSLFSVYKYVDTPKIQYTSIIHPTFYDLTNWTNIASTTFTRQKTFACLFSILLGCDNAHDFTYSSVSYNFDREYRTPGIKSLFHWLTHKKTVTENKQAIFGYLRAANIESVINACLKMFGSYSLLAHCICVINMESFRLQTLCNPNIAQGTLLPNPQNPAITEELFCKNSLLIFFSTDKNAKKVASAIAGILGIEQSGSRGLNKNADISTRGIYRGITERAPANITVRIDAVSASVNHAADVMLMTNDTNALTLVDDIASKMDPARDGVLNRILKRFRRIPSQPSMPVDIDVFVEIDQQRHYFTKSLLRPVNDKIRLTVSDFLLKTFNTPSLVLSGENSNSRIMVSIIDKWMTTYKKDPPNLPPAKAANFKDFIKKRTCLKTLGDFLQIIMHTDTQEPKAFHTFDKIAGIISGILNKVTIVDAGTGEDQLDFRYVMLPSSVIASRNLEFMNCVREFFGLEVTFGKINNISKRLKSMSHLELKNKLKSVGIKITKNVRGKRKYLSRKELENKALLFNKLQNTAKRIKIKIMYKSRNGLYKYKTYKRLQKEINSKYNTDRKYQKPVVKNFNFG